MTVAETRANTNKSTKKKRNFCSAANSLIVKLGSVRWPRVSQQPNTTLVTTANAGLLCLNASEGLWSQQRHLKQETAVQSCSFCVYGWQKMLPATRGVDVASKRVLSRITTQASASFIQILAPVFLMVEKKIWGRSLSQIKQRRPLNFLQLLLETLCL